MELRGAAILSRLDRGFHRLDGWLHTFVPPRWNPLQLTGALANAALIWAIVSGVVVLIWYESSVHLAWDSIVRMDAAPFSAGLVRSLHRYSSDACMALVVLHAVRLFAAGRFTGARWLAWFTGIGLIALLWVVGWLGYWLIWDQRAQLVAVGTARMLDALPIFADPMGRSFLADSEVNSLLFFVVFFAHMLVPLVMGVFLWLHIARLARPDFLPSRRGWLVLSAVLVAMSLLWPADTAPPAKMALAPGPMVIDAWFLAPLALTDRLSGPLLWALTLVAAALIVPAPWWFARGERRPAAVDPTRCNACERCVHDCPYLAIEMVPRTDGKHFLTQSSIIASRCVECGICAGSCNSAAIGLPWMPVQTEHERIAAWMAAAVAAGTKPLLALVADGGSAVQLTVDGEGRCATLLGFHVLRVPCSGWIHMQVIERAIKAGAAGVLIGACGDNNCRDREGHKWTLQRLDGGRLPLFRGERYDRSRVAVVSLDRGAGALREAAAALAAGAAVPAAVPPSLTRARAGLVGLAAISAVAVWAPSRWPYAPPVAEQPQLALSFKHPGKATQRCRTPSPEELEAMPIHMRQPQICDRQRAAVRVQLRVDGRTLLDHSYEPRGLWGDGNSVAFEQVDAPPGRHRVEIALDDGGDGWDWQEARELAFRRGHRHAIGFDRTGGFVWHQAGDGPAAGAPAPPPSPPAAPGGPAPARAP